jgi:ethanolamine ammonia-lyase large subunit
VHWTKTYVIGVSVYFEIGTGKIIVANMNYCVEQMTISRAMYHQADPVSNYLPGKARKASLAAVFVHSK